MPYARFALLTLGVFILAVALQAALLRIGARFRSGERKAGAYRAASGQGVSSKLPMTGGVALVITVMLGGLAVVAAFHTWPGAWKVAAALAMFALVGLADDIGKYRGRGLPQSWKTLGCLAAAAVTAALLTFGAGFEADVGSIFRFLVSTAFLFSFAVAADFSDGIDGLAAGLGAIISFAMLAAAYVAHRAGAGMWAIALVAILAFWLFNLPSAWTSRGTARRRARVYLGDSGALAMGGGLAAAALYMHLGWIFVPAAGVWLIEGFSSLWQAEFLAKRVYRRFGRVERYGAARAPHTEFPLPLLASPIHHHFEMAGWDRLQIVKLFYAVALACGAGAVVAALPGYWLAAGYIVAGAAMAALWSFAGLYRTCYLAVGDAGRLALNSGMPFRLGGKRYAKRLVLTGCDATVLSPDARLWLYRPMARPDAMEVLIRLLAANGCEEEASALATALPAGMREMRLADVALKEPAS